MANLSRVGFPRKLRKNLKKSDVEYVRKVKSKLDDAKQFRISTRENIWRANEKRYMGEQWPNMADDRTADKIVVNKIFSTIATIVPYVAEGEVEFIVEPYSGAATSASAKLVGIWLNRMWRTNKFDGSRYVANATWDSLLYGDGYMMAGYDIIEQVIRGADGNPVPLSEKNIAEFVLENVSPWDVWIDRYADGLADARWYFRRFTLPLDVAQNDDRFFNPDEIATMDNVNHFEDGRFYANEMRQGEEQMAVMYEYWDKDTGQMLVFSDTSEIPHMWIEHVNSNLVQIPNHPIPNLPYHMSEVEQINQLQDELNKTRSQMITHRRRNVPKVIYDSAAFDTKALSGLQSSVIMEGIPANSASGPISESVHMLSPVPVPEDTYNVAQIISGDIDDITGVNEFLRGAMTTTRKTATEATIIEGASNTKIKHKLMIVERAARQLGQILVELAAEVLPTTEIQELQLYLTGEEALAALTAGGQDIYSEEGDLNDALLVPSPQLFQGKYEVFVQQGSSELRNPQIKEQKMHKMVTTLLASYQILAQGGVFVDMAKALRLWLESLGITDVNSILNSQRAVQSWEQQQIAQMMMMQQGADPTGLGQPDTTGEPNAAGAAPPEALPDPTNSGMMPPAEQSAY